MKMNISLKVKLSCNKKYVICVNTNVQWEFLFIKTNVYNLKNIALCNKKCFLFL